MIEIWKKIKGYEDYYEISNFGRIKSLHRNGLYLRQFRNNKGYLITQLSKNGNSKTFIVHRLVAETFIDNTYNKEQVNHKNCNKLDNRVCNLEWVTNDENKKHAQEHGLCKSSVKGGKNKLSKKVNQYTIEGKLVKQWECLSDIKREFKLKCCSNISSCCKNKLKTAYGYVWKYNYSIGE